MINPGDVIDRYTVDAVIGHGGTAVVYKVHHTHLGTVHALKILALSHPGIKKRMMREGQVQATLDHPNIVAVTDVFAIDNQPALLMEFVEGPTLETWVAENPRPPLVEAERLFRAVVLGVKHAHKQGLVHRDLKPANVLLCPDDRGWIPKVTDFGLAKVLHQNAAKGQTHAGVAMGTPDYMAPEQIRDAGAVDKRADIFSLGCILYELLCGQGPFTGPDIIQIYNNVASGTYPDPKEIRPDLPDRFLNAITGCLVSDREHRIADCGTLLDVLAGSPLPVYVEGAGPHDTFDSGEFRLDAPPVPGRSQPLDTLSDDETQEAPLDPMMVDGAADDAPPAPRQRVPLDTIEGPPDVGVLAVETTAPQRDEPDEDDDDRTLQLPGVVVAREGEEPEPEPAFSPVVLDQETEKLPEDSLPGDLDPSDTFDVQSNSSAGIYVVVAMAALLLLVAVGLAGGGAMLISSNPGPQVPQLTPVPTEPASAASAEVEVEEPQAVEPTPADTPEPEPEPPEAEEPARVEGSAEPLTRTERTADERRSVTRDSSATAGFQTTKQPDPAPRRPAATPVTVKLLSVPPSAKLSIDGVDKGMTPAKLDLTPGGHTVVMDQGGNERTFRIKVSEDGDAKWCYNFERDSSHTGSCPR